MSETLQITRSPTSFFFRHLFNYKLLMFGIQPIANLMIIGTTALSLPVGLIFISFVGYALPYSYVIFVIALAIAAAEILKEI